MVIEVNIAAAELLKWTITDQMRTKQARSTIMIILLQKI